MDGLQENESTALLYQLIMELSDDNDIREFRHLHYKLRIDVISELHHLRKQMKAFSSKEFYNALCMAINELSRQHENGFKSGQGLFARRSKMQKEFTEKAIRIVETHSEKLAHGW